MQNIDQSKLRIFLLHWLPPIVYCVAIFIQSSLPGSERMPDIRFFDKLLHFLAYALLGILFYRAYGTLPLRNNYKLLIFISILSTTLYGISDEIHQYFVPSRHADIMDVIANTLGSICGVYLCYRWKGRKKSQSTGDSQR
ncbi:MAG: VanZ family protein [Desulfobacterales bacterium]